MSAPRTRRAPKRVGCACNQCRHANLTAVISNIVSVKKPRSQSSEESDRVDTPTLIRPGRHTVTPPESVFIKVPNGGNWQDNVWTTVAHDLTQSDLTSEDSPPPAQPQSPVEVSDQGGPPSVPTNSPQPLTTNVDQSIDSQELHQLSTYIADMMPVNAEIDAFLEEDAEGLSTVEETAETTTSVNHTIRRVDGALTVRAVRALNTIIRAPMSDVPQCGLDSTGYGVLYSLREALLAEPQWLERAICYMNATRDQQKDARSAQ